MVPFVYKKRVCGGPPSMARSLIGAIVVGVLITSIRPDTVSAADGGLLDQELIELYTGTSVNPFDVAGTNNLAMKLVRQGQYTRGLRLLDRALQLAPERRDIARNIQELRMLIAQLESLDMDSAIRYDRSFDTEEVPYVPQPWGLDDDDTTVSTVAIAAEPVGPAADVNPFDAQSLISIANVKMERGEYRDALADLKRAKQLSPWLTELDPQIAQLESQLSDLGNSDEIIEQFSPSGTYDDGLGNPEPPTVWSMDDITTPQP